MSKKIKNEGALLAMFCNPDSKREQFRQPFLNTVTGTVWATDAYMLISIAPNRLNSQYPEMKLQTNNDFNDHNCDKVLTLAAIDKALELCPQCDEQVKAEDPIPCAECNGKGTVKWTYEGNNFRLYEMEDECPVCNGRGFSRGTLLVKTGRNVPVDGSTVHMGGGLYLGTTMQRLRDAMSLLGVDSVHVVRIHKAGLCKCVVDDDTYIIFMSAMQRKGTVLASPVIKLQKKGGKLC